MQQTLQDQIGQNVPLPRVTDPGELKGEMLYRKLGGTGETVSAIGMGGSHIGKPALAESEAIRLIHEGVDRGITFLDNCWDYNEGQSEVRMGKALAQGNYRNRVFLMTKIDGRTKGEAQKQIDTSLQRLQTDRIDLLQFHEVIRFEDPDRIFSEGGAMEAFQEAKKAGKLRYIGFTGHKHPLIHLHMLETAGQHGFHFDTVQMSLNVFDAHFRSFAHVVVPRAVEERIAVLAMKTFGGADGVFFRSPVLANRTISPIDCLHYSLNLPSSVVITGIDDQRSLDQAFAAAKSFTPMSPEQVTALLSKTQPFASTGQYELNKSTMRFDSTTQNSFWLGTNTQQTYELAPPNSG